MMILSLGKAELGMTMKLPGKIQAITTSQLFWQSVDIGSITIQVETLVFNWEFYHDQTVRESLVV
jgi:hypothetical protein